MNDPAGPQAFSEGTITIVGVGLIGGSIAKALKVRGFAGRIVGVGRNPKRLEAAQTAGLIDIGISDLSLAADQADLIVFCTPVDLIAKGVRTAAANCRPGGLITDVGSVKGSVCRELRGELPEGVTFIGSHPLAGSEKQGFEHAHADLFHDQLCIVTPQQSTPPEQLSRLTGFWQFLGCQVVELPVEDHDAVLAHTSHLPHVVAATLASAVSESLFRRYAASGFRDTTRIAAGDPALWVGILTSNADEVVSALDWYAGKLAQFQDAIANRDAVALKKLLELAKTNRDSLDES